MEDMRMKHKVAVRGFKGSRVNRKHACHPCPQYGRRASGRSEPVNAYRKILAITDCGLFSV